MAIIHKRSERTGKLPSSATVTQGELAINTADGLLFTKLSDNRIFNLVQRTGTWVPVFEQTNVEPLWLTYGLQAGNWARTGDLVWVQGIIELQATIGVLPGASLWVAGLPYSYINNGCGGFVYGVSGITPAGADFALLGQGSGGTQYRMKVRHKTTTSTSFTDTTASALSATSTFRFVSVYRTTDPA